MNAAAHLFPVGREQVALQVGIVFQAGRVGVTVFSFGGRDVLDDLHVLARTGKRPEKQERTEAVRNTHTRPARDWRSALAPCAVYLVVWCRTLHGRLCVYPHK